MTPFLIAKEPQPTWRMLYPHFRGKCLPLPVHGKPTYYLFWARNAIYHGLTALRLKPDDNVLAPAYHCASAIEPICQYGARVIFYNVRRDGSPDFQDLQAKIDKSTRALLAIHYFGFPQPIRELQAFCQAHRLYLIEDCAHVLVGEAEGDVLGSFGDISIFSWRKFLPLYAGGLLVINNPTCQVDIPWQRNSLFFLLKVVKNLSEQLLGNSEQKTAKAISYFSGYANLIGKHILSTRKTYSKMVMINNYSVDFDLAQVYLRMSKISKYILQNADFSSIIEK
jgi:perosamine synthetase